MDKNIVRSTMLALAFMCFLHTVPAEAWGFSLAARALGSYIHRSAGMCNNVSRPLAILSVAGSAFIGSLWLYNHFVYRPRVYRTKQIPAQNVPIKQPSLMSRIWNWFKPEPTYTKAAAIQAEMPQASVTEEQPLEITASPDEASVQMPAMNLAQRIRMPVDGYQEATANQLAIVPYFNDPSNLIEEAIQFQNPDDGAHETVQQVRAFNQFGDPDVNGYGVACGLHVVKNAAALAGLISGHDTGALLTGRDEAAELLGSNPQGILRRAIIRIQKKRALRDILVAQALRTKPLLTPGTNESPGWMGNGYVSLLERFFEHQITRVEHGQEVIITPENIIDHLVQAGLPEDIVDAMLRQEPARKHAAEGRHDETEANRDYYEEFTTSLNNRETIVRYINSENPIHITQEDLNGAIETYNRNPLFSENQIPLNGEYAAIHDIKDLVATQRLQGDSPFAVSLGNTPVTVYSPHQNSFELNEAIRTLRDNIFSQTLPEQRTQAFILGNGGHWVVVIGEFAPGHRRWTIADSATNNVRMFDGIIADFIRFCEGQRAGQLITRQT